jgi:tripartite-type tricarboxylate transporter receptor subunit TctC
MTQTNFVIVHYRGSAQIMNDMLAGNVDMVFDNIPSIIEHARTGSVKALGITTLKRSTVAPEYPPVADTVPGYDTTSWIGVAVRTGTPKEICDKIESAGQAICKDPVLKQRLATLVSESVDSSASAFAAYANDERKKWGKLITDLKIKVE